MIFLHLNRLFKESILLLIYVFFSHFYPTKPSTLQTSIAPTVATTLANYSCFYKFENWRSRTVIFYQIQPFVSFSLKSIQRRRQAFARTVFRMKRTGARLSRRRQGPQSCRNEHSVRLEKKLRENMKFFFEKARIFQKTHCSATPTSIDPPKENQRQYAKFPTSSSNDENFCKVLDN